MRRVCELRGGKASCQVRDRVMRRGGGKESEGGEGAGCSIVGVTNCRGLEPAITRLWGKGVSITLARMDQFNYNLGLDL